MFHVPPYRLWHRPLPVRIACGVLGALTLAALAFGTIREATDVYQKGNLGEDTLHLPTLPAPAFSETEGRFLIYLVATTKDLGTGTRPVFVREFDVGWPKDLSREFEWLFRACGFDYTLRLSLQGVHKKEDSESPWIEPDWTLENRNFSTSESSSFATPLLWKDSQKRWSNIENLDEVDTDARLEGRILSLVPQRLLAHIDLRVLATRVERGDPIDRKSVV